MGERERALSNWPPCHLKKKIGDKVCHVSSFDRPKLDFNYTLFLKVTPSLF